MKSTQFTLKGAQLGFDLLLDLMERAPSKRSSADAVPRWAPGPLLRANERTKPPLSWPRTTDSLCPRCVIEARTAILEGRADLDALRSSQGEIPARIEEDGGQVVMRKTCPRHGDFEDVISTDPQFLARIERLFPGRDYAAPKSPHRNHGSSTIKYGRGAVLTLDLTNRCNMMCDPCFMDANQVGYVHELQWDEIQLLLQNSLEIKPRRQLSVQFSGGEPTLSPHFLAAIREARRLGYFSVQAASNGIRFAQDFDFCLQAKEAGLRLVYLQFDGVTNEANSHRKVGNLFDVKLQAIENLHRAGIDTALVVTVVNGVNNHQVGPIIEFAIDNADKITVVSFQPVSFTGRDEDISDERRKAQRYTLSQLAHDIGEQLGATHPHRDWFPLSAMNPLSDLVDMLMGPDQDFGALKCGCHPNCGIGTVLVVDKETHSMVPLCEFLDLESFLADVQRIADARRSKVVTKSLVALSLFKNFRKDKAPRGYGFTQLLRQFSSQTGSSGDSIGSTEGDAKRFRFRLLFVAGMWFQDLFNYDFRRTEMCIIPYGTQEGEISFCAYNTGVGWRQVVEKMHQSATVRDWYREHGKHGVYAKNQTLPLSVARDGVARGSIMLRDEAARSGRRRLPVLS